MAANESAAATGRARAWKPTVSATRARTFPGGEFGLPCVLVLKRLNEGERHEKSQLNAVLRDYLTQGLPVRGSDGERRRRYENRRRSETTLP